MRNNRLTPKQEAFVEAYLRLQNGTAAYKEAYDKTGGMSDNTASSGATENLRNPKVSGAIEQKKERLRLLSTVCTIEELAEGWTDEIRFDIGELVDDEGNLKNPKDLSPKAKKLVQSLKLKDGLIEYKLPDRQKAKVELGKRLGFYPPEKHVLPDKKGEPQEVGFMSNIDMAARLLFLLDKAKRRKELHDSSSGVKDQ